MMPVDSEQLARAKDVDIRDVADRLGLSLKKASISEWVGPCPVCGGKDRFSINTKLQVFNCRGCAKGDSVIGLVRHVRGDSFADAVDFILGGTADETKRAKSFPVSRQSDAESPPINPLWLWRQRRPISGSPAERYLREARGYRGPLPPTLGYLPPHGAHLPAMIAAFGTAEEPEPGLLAIDDRAIRGVHLTKLTLDGSGKAGTDKDKIFIGSSLGSPIVLAPPNDLLGLVIAEGVEEALSAHIATGLGAWAAGAHGRMPALAEAVPSYIDCVTILADPDAGLESAHKLRDALKERKIRAAVSRLVREDRAA